MFVRYPKSIIQRASTLRIDSYHLFLKNERLGLRTLSKTSSPSKAAIEVKNNLSQQNGEAAVVVSTTRSLSLPSDGLRLFNSLTRKLEPFVLSVPNRSESASDSSCKKGLAWYTCGPTVYAPAHLGHARTYVWLDIIRRVIEHEYRRIGTATSSDSAWLPPPLFVLNITDVDDKILEAANASQEPAVDLARRFEAEFFKEWDELNCLRPHVVTRVTEHVQSAIVPYIQKICNQGRALTYFLEGDGLYFDVRAFEVAAQAIQSRYGKLSPSVQATETRSTTLAETNTNHSSDADVEAEIRAEQTKRDPRDFCLWKLRKDGEQMYWSSPWGDGRPGWHIECSAMIESVQDLFRDHYAFMAHAGGIDLQFPHHTNEIAQAEAYHLPKQISQRLTTNDDDSMKHTSEWIPHWIHTGHLHIDGMKMSKSLKNFIPISDLLSQGKDNPGPLSSPADDFRLWCLMSGSYRGTALYTASGIAEARRIRIEKICKLLEEGQEWIQSVAIEDVGRNSREKTWSSMDVQLFLNANQCRNNCISALKSDIDGTNFLKELFHLIDQGLAYIRRRQKANDDKSTDGALRHVLDTLRDLLALVGFSHVTCRVALGHVYEERCNTTFESRILGGERALLDEVVRFRKAIRDATLSTGSKSEGDDSKALKTEILRLCDEVRDLTFPGLGVQLHDGKYPVKNATDEGGSNDIQGSSTASSSYWSYCIPVSNTEAAVNIGSQQPKATTVPRQKSLEDLPLQDYFRVGRYEGMFSAFTPDGFPTHNSDGTEVSKSLSKKLLKKLQALDKPLNDHQKE